MAREHFFRLVQETKEPGICLMVDMEESDKLEAILEIYQQVAAHHPHVGITLAAHLYRTPQDLEALHKTTPPSDPIYSPNMRFYDANVLLTHCSQDDGGKPVTQQPRPVLSPHPR